MSTLVQNGAMVYIVGRRKEKLEVTVKMHQVVCLSESGRMLKMTAFEKE